jgi:hypothetical protein
VQGALECGLDGCGAVNALERLAQGAFRHIGGYARGFDGTTHAPRTEPADTQSGVGDGGGGTIVVEGALGTQACQRAVHVVVRMGPACQAQAQLRLGQFAAGEQAQAVKVSVSQIA